MITGKLYKPTGSGKYPAVVMLHGCSGIYSFSDPTKGVGSLFKEWGERLVNAGYVALLVDSYTPRSAPQNQCGSSVTSPVNDRTYDAYAAYHYLHAQSYITDSIGLLGWSAGGSSAMATMVYTASTQANFRAAAIFYAGCGLNNAFDGLAASTWKPYAHVRFFHGTADTVVSLSHCQTRVNRAITLGASTATGNSVELTSYQGAHHSFDMAKQVGNGFTTEDLDAKADADPKVMTLFSTYLKP
ncbi:MAG: hypothetical protein OHK0022_59780 [Roseiflexaceae bacterium]